MRSRLALPPAPVEIDAGWLQLRPWELHLAPRALEALTDLENQRWAPRPIAGDLAAVTKWIEERIEAWRAGRMLSFAINDAASGDLLGGVMLTDINEFTRTGMVGYWTAPWARRRGVASAALATLTRWGFDTIGLHRLELGHAVENSVSCRVAAKAGYDVEGVLRSALPKPDGGWWDIELHAAINPEY